MPVWFSESMSSVDTPLFYQARSHQELLSFFEQLFTDLSRVSFHKQIQSPLKVNKLPEILVHEDANVQEKINQLWDEERKTKPFLFDGTVACFGNLEESSKGSVLSIYPTSYKLVHILLTYPNIQKTCKLIPNGVSGVVSVVEDGQIWILLGKRSNVAKYSNKWECAPSGALDVGDKVDPKKHVLQELREETNITLSSIKHVKILGLWLDTYVKTYDLCYCIYLHNKVHVPNSTAEYSDIQWVPIHKVWQYDMIPLAGSILCFLATQLFGYKNVIPQRTTPRLQ